MIKHLWRRIFGVKCGNCEGRRYIYTQETTGLYAIYNQELLLNKCRVGRRPILYDVNYIEAIDIDNKEDLEYARFISKYHNIK